MSELKDFSIAEVVMQLPGQGPVVQSRIKLTQDVSILIQSHSLGGDEDFCKSFLHFILMLLALKRPVKISFENSFQQKKRNLG